MGWKLERVYNDLIYLDIKMGELKVGVNFEYLIYNVSPLSSEQENGVG